MTGRLYVPGPVGASGGGGGGGGGSASAIWDDNFDVDQLFEYDIATFSDGGSDAVYEDGKLKPTHAGQSILTTFTNHGDVNALAALPHAGAFDDLVAGTIVKYIDEENMLLGLMSGRQLNLLTMIDGTFDFLSTQANVNQIADHEHYLVTRIEGNLFSTEWWLDDPRVSGAAVVPYSTLTSTLVGGSAALFGEGVEGRIGMFQGAGGIFEDFTVTDATRGRLNF